MFHFFLKSWKTFIYIFVFQISFNPLCSYIYLQEKKKSFMFMRLILKQFYVSVKNQNAIVIAIKKNSTNSHPFILGRLS